MLKLYMSERVEQDGVAADKVHGHRTEVAWNTLASSQ